MIADRIIYFLLGSDASRKELFTVPLQHDQKDRLIPRIGEHIVWDNKKYLVREILYNFDFSSIAITVKTD